MGGWCWSGAVHGLGSNGQDCNKHKQWRLTAISATAHTDRCRWGKSLAGVRLAEVWSAYRPVLWVIDKAFYPVEAAVHKLK